MITMLAQGKISTLPIARVVIVPASEGGLTDERMGSIRSLIEIFEGQIEQARVRDLAAEVITAKRDEQLLQAVRFIPENIVVVTVVFFTIRVIPQVILARDHLHRGSVSWNVLVYTGPRATTIDEEGVFPVDCRAIKRGSVVSMLFEE